MLAIPCTGQRIARERSFYLFCCLALLLITPAHSSGDIIHRVGFPGSACSALALSNESGEVFAFCGPAVFLRQRHGDPVVYPLPAGNDFLVPFDSISGPFVSISGDGNTIASGIGDLALHNWRQAVWTSDEILYYIEDELPGIDLDLDEEVYLSDAGDLLMGNGNISGTNDVGWRIPGGFIAGCSGFAIDFNNQYYHALSPDGNAYAESEYCDTYTQHRVRVIGGGALYYNTISDTRALSHDGSMAVGANASGFAVRYDGTSEETLGSLGPDDISSVALDVSGDGSVVVGTVQTPSGSVAFIWDEAQGMRSLYDELTARGADVSGWELEYVVGINRAGNIIAGNGLTPDGSGGAFFIDLDAAPLPTSDSMGIWILISVLLGAGAAMLMRMPEFRGSRHESH